MLNFSLLLYDAREKRLYGADWVQSAEDVQENTRREIHFLKDHFAILQEHLNCSHKMKALLVDEAQKECQTELQKLGAES
jgi:hypothetical protein